MARQFASLASSLSPQQQYNYDSLCLHPVSELFSLSLSLTNWFWTSSSSGDLPLWVCAAGEEAGFISSIDRRWVTCIVGAEARIKAGRPIDWEIDGGEVANRSVGQTANFWPGGSLGESMALNQRETNERTGPKISSGLVRMVSFKNDSFIFSCRAILFLLFFDKQS